MGGGKDNDLSYSADGDFFVKYKGAKSRKEYGLEGRSKRREEKVQRFTGYRNEGEDSSPEIKKKKHKKHRTR